MEQHITLQSKIELIEEEISKKYRDEFQDRENRIDFSKSGWTEEMKQIGMEYRKKIEPELNYIRQVVLQALQHSHYSIIQDLAALLQQTKKLSNYIAPSFEEIEERIQKGSDEYLLLSVVLFIMSDMKPDARDAMLYFSDLVKFCKTKNIDIKPVLQNLLSYTSTEIKFGNYSMKAMFEQAIEQSTPTRKQKK